MWRCSPSIRAVRIIWYLNFYSLIAQHGLWLHYIWRPIGLVDNRCCWDAGSCVKMGRRPQMFAAMHFVKLLANYCCGLADVYSTLLEPFIRHPIFERMSMDSEATIRCIFLIQWTILICVQDGGTTAQTWSPKLYIENSIGEPTSTILTSTLVDETAATFVVEQRRLRGTFTKPMQLHYFPFDVQVVILSALISHNCTDSYVARGCTVHNACMCIDLALYRLHTCVHGY